MPELRKDKQDNASLVCHLQLPSNAHPLIPPALWPWDQSAYLHFYLWTELCGGSSTSAAPKSTSKGPVALLGAGQT